MKKLTIILFVILIIGIPVAYSEPNIIVQPNVDFEELSWKFEIIKSVSITYHGNVRIKEDVYSLTNLNYSKYLRGVKTITFTKNLRDCGHYYPGGTILINPTCAYLDRWLLHELKHHHCWNQNKNLEPNHKGCFLNTPIDKELGYIQ